MGDTKIKSKRIRVPKIAASWHSFAVSAYPPVPQELLFKSGVLYLVRPNMMEPVWTALSGACGNYQRGIYDNIWKIHCPEYLIHFNFPLLSEEVLRYSTELFIVPVSKNRCRLSIFIFSTKRGIFVQD